MLPSPTPLEISTNHTENLKRRRSFSNNTSIIPSSFLMGFTTRFHNFIWFLIFAFTLYSMPYLEFLLSYKIHLFWNEAYASEEQTEEATSKEISSDESTVEEGVSADKETLEKTPKEKASTLSGTSLMSSEGTGGGGGPFGIAINTPEPYLFTGAATHNIPIQVPPGRGGMAPQILLTYNSYQGNGWVGVGWNLDMGAIQRSTRGGQLWCK